MRFYIYAAFVLGLLAQCGSKIASKDTIAKKFSIRTHFVMIGLDGVVQNIDDTVNIIYHGNYVLCELPFEFFLEDGKRILQHETKFKYFIFRKNQPQGQIFDSLTSAKG
ncbi:MAG: hypothetical protein ABJA78_01215 [Ferruginibacter sp.]